MTGRHRNINVRHAQAWILIATYKFKMMHFPQAWLTPGRATRLTQMMGLHRLDGLGLDVKQSLPTTTDWSEKEERRRIFWMAFCMDQYASVGTGWPMIVDERDVCNRIPEIYVSGYLLSLIADSHEPTIFRRSIRAERRIYRHVSQRGHESLECLWPIIICGRSYNSQSDWSNS